MSGGLRGNTGRASVFFVLVFVMLPLRASAQETVLAAVPEVNQPHGLAAVMPLYASYAVLQALDIHATQSALKRGAVEANPLMQGVVGKPVAFAAFKLGTGAAVIYLAEKVRTRSRIGAVLLMTALNSVSATIVAHNYRTATR